MKSHGWSLRYHKQIFLFQNDDIRGLITPKKCEPIFQISTKLKLYQKIKYSQTCVQRPPLGPEKSGPCSEVVVIQRVKKILN